MEREIEEAKNHARPAVYGCVLAMHRAPNESGDLICAILA